jgi:hypothetical protein
MMTSRLSPQRALTVIAMQEVLDVSLGRRFAGGLWSKLFGWSHRKGLKSTVSGGVIARKTGELCGMTQRRLWGSRENTLHIERATIWIPPTYR